MSRVFISYRHDDTEADAGRLYDTLTAALGAAALYKDVADIEIGRNWKHAVRDALADAVAVLVVMGPEWRPSIAIQFELELALASEVPVVPVLVRGADLRQLMTGLPTALSELGERHAVTLSHASWSNDCRALVETLKSVLADPTRARVLIEPPDPNCLLYASNWPSVSNRDQLLEFAEDLAECLRDPSIKRTAKDSYDRFEEQEADQYWRRHNIQPTLLAVVQTALQRLSIEQYVRELLALSPPENDWDTLAAVAASLGALIGDPSIAERASQELKDIREEVSELNRSKGDSGDPAMIRESQTALNELVRAGKSRLITEIPGIDQPGFTNRYPQRKWPAAAFGRTREFGE